MEIAIVMFTLLNADVWLLVYERQLRSSCKESVDRPSSIAMYGVHILIDWSQQIIRQWFLISILLYTTDRRSSNPFF